MSNVKIVVVGGNLHKKLLGNSIDLITLDDVAKNADTYGIGMMEVSFDDLESRILLNSYHPDELYLQKKPTVKNDKKPKGPRNRWGVVK